MSCFEPYKVSANACVRFCERVIGIIDPIHQILLYCPVSERPDE